MPTLRSVLCKAIQTATHSSNTTQKSFIKPVIKQQVYYTNVRLSSIQIKRQQSTQVQRNSLCNTNAKKSFNSTNTSLKTTKSYHTSSTVVTNTATTTNQPVKFKTFDLLHQYNQTKQIIQYHAEQQQQQDDDQQQYYSSNNNNSNGKRKLWIGMSAITTGSASLALSDTAAAETNVNDDQNDKKSELLDVNKEIVKQITLSDSDNDSDSDSEWIDVDMINELDIEDNNVYNNNNVYDNNTVTNKQVDQHISESNLLLMTDLQDIRTLKSPSPRTFELNINQSHFAYNLNIDDMSPMQRSVSDGAVQSTVDDTVDSNRRSSYSGSNNINSRTSSMSSSYDTTPLQEYIMYDNYNNTASIRLSKKQLYNTVRWYELGQLIADNNKLEFVKLHNCSIKQGDIDALINGLNTNQIKHVKSFELNSTHLGNVQIGMLHVRYNLQAMLEQSIVPNIFCICIAQSYIVLLSQVMTS